MLKNKTTLLALIAILAIVRFVLIPVFEGQADKQVQLRMVSDQLGRAEVLLDNADALTAELERVQAINQEVGSFLPVMRDRSTARVQLQQTIEGLARENSTQISLFDWTQQRNLVDGQLSELHARVVIQGSLSQLAAFQRSMQERLLFVSIENFEMQTTSGGRPGQQNYRLTLALRANILIAEAL
ncbi:MAG: hypothetical protein LAT77_11265 [Aliidiomarina sp.]|uniref:hypothetical protein n=1 Tax=Aliidiomarina sp. TaxID=1872439 RepID=UPI0025B955C7|nr:hypothetical protein [Aliidiomarina sp.]MCH8502475.1 hypothetical protein [Aliidiomarina sp.]